MESRLQFVVSGRLDPKKPFERLETRSTFDILSTAEERAKEWYEGKKDLTKARPETIIESVLLPHLIDCYQCAAPLFKDDLYFYKQGKSYCYDCSLNFSEGLYDLV